MARPPGRARQLPGEAANMMKTNDSDRAGNILSVVFKLHPLLASDLFDRQIGAAAAGRPGPLDSIALAVVSYFGSDCE